MREYLQEKDIIVHGLNGNFENDFSIFIDNKDQNLIIQKNNSENYLEWEDIFEIDDLQLQLAENHSQTNLDAMVNGEEAHVNPLPSTDQIDSSGQMESQQNFFNHFTDHSQVRSIEQSFQHDLISLQSKQSPILQTESQSFGSQSSSVEQNPTGNIQKNHQKLTKDLRHLRNSRRPKGVMSMLQEELGGQKEGKSLLPTARKILLDYIIRTKGSKFIKQHPELEQFKKRSNIVMRDFQFIFKLPYLKTLLDQFFRRKVLYRGLMLSKAAGKRKRANIKFLESFEYAYLTGQFTSLTKIRTKELRMLKSQRQILLGNNQQGAASSVENHN